MKHILLALSGLIAICIGTALSNAAGEESPAALLAFERVGNNLVFDVVSTGCTKDTDFYLLAEGANSQATMIILVRKNADRCRGMPSRYQITRSISEISGKPRQIILGNPFIELVKRKS